MEIVPGERLNQGRREPSPARVAASVATERGGGEGGSEKPGGDHFTSIVVVRSSPSAVW